MRVAINMAPDGTFTVYTDAESEVYVVCDHCPGDRVYRLSDSHLVGSDLVTEQLGNSTVGHSGDDRHEAIANRINSELSGERHLKPVN